MWHSGGRRDGWREEEDIIIIASKRERVEGVRLRGCIYIYRGRESERARERERESARARARESASTHLFITAAPRSCCSEVVMLAAVFFRDALNDAISSEAFEASGAMTKAM